MDKTKNSNTGLMSPTPAPRQFLIREELFDDDFQDFDEFEFVETMSKKTAFEQQEELRKKKLTPQLRVQPFIELFEKRLEDLSHLSELLDTKILSLAEDVQKAHQKNGLNISEIEKKLQLANTHFTQLDNKVLKVSSSVGKIGKDLQISDLRRSRALESKILIELFNHLNAINTEDTPNDQRLTPQQLWQFFYEFEIDMATSQIKANTILKENSSTFQQNTLLFQKAIILKKLLRISAELPRNHTVYQVALRNLEIISDYFENLMLAEFSEGARNSNIQLMKERANTLTEFNGGESCISRYIGMLETFFNIDLLKRDDELSTRAFNKSERIDSRIEEFFTNIDTESKNEYLKICQVFAHPGSVMRHFLEKLFKLRVQRFVESILSTDKRLSSLQYLRTFERNYRKTQIFFEILNQYDIPDSDFHFESWRNLTFSEDKKLYIRTELNSLNNYFHVSFKDHKNTSMANLGNFEKILNFIHMFEEATQRCVLLSIPSEKAQNLVLLFSTVIRTIGHDVVYDDLHSRVNNMMTVCQNFVSVPKTFSNLEMFLQNVHFVNQVVIFIENFLHLHLVTYFHTFFQFFSVLSFFGFKRKKAKILIKSVQSPHFTPSETTEANECQITKDSLSLKLEGCIEIGFEKLLDGFLSCVTRILETQKRKDYKIKVEVVDVKPTTACFEMVSFIKKSCKALSSNLDGTNLTNVLEYYGQRISEVLVEHYHKFKVSPGNGGLRLLADLTEYKELSKIFQNSKITSEFEKLNEISRLFFVGPENFKKILLEGKLVNMQKEEVVSYLQLRSDFQPKWVEEYL